MNPHDKFSSSVTPATFPVASATTVLADAEGRTGPSWRKVLREALDCSRKAVRGAGPAPQSAPTRTESAFVYWCCAEVGTGTSWNTLERTLPGCINTGRREEAGIVNYRKNAQTKGGKEKEV